MAAVTGEIGSIIWILGAIFKKYFTALGDLLILASKKYIRISLILYLNTVLVWTNRKIDRKKVLGITL